MDLLTPLAQEGPGDRSGDLQTQTLPEPLIDAPNPVEWLGFGAGAVILLIIMLFMIRARVIAPARRRAAAKEAIFEPAGEDAEITFDDDAPLSHHDSDAHQDNGHSPDLVADALEPGDFRNEDESEPKKSRSPFAGLFSQKRNDKDESQQVGLGEPDDHDSIGEITAEHAPHFEEGQYHESVVTAHPPAEQLRNLDDDVELRRRQAEQEEHEHLKEEAQFRAEQSRKLQEERDRAYHAAREDALRETEFERRKNEAALEQRLRSLASVERKLNEKADTLGADSQFVEKRLNESLEERFAALSQELNQRLEEASAHRDEHAQPSAADMADYVGRELANLRRSMQDSIDRLAKRIDESSASPQSVASLAAQFADISGRLDAKAEVGAHAASPPLSDLIRRFAPSGRTVFNAHLSDGRQVDCCVALTDGVAPIVIDDQYPAEAYEHYLRERASSTHAQAANAYRRAVLRQVVHVSENMIVPGETASSAILFAPTDAIVNDLHTNFPDLIEDSYQAHVWIVSPASLGATLSAMAAAGGRDGDDHAHQTNLDTTEDDALLAEIDRLRKRVAKHEDDVAELAASPLTPPETDALASAPIESEEDAGAPEDRLTPDQNRAPKTNGAGHPSMSPEEEAFERLERLEREEALAAAQEKESTTKGPKERPPFPLR